MTEENANDVEITGEGKRRLDDDGLFVLSPNAMMTWTRHRVDPTIMTPEDVNIEDIAHGIARQCRYNGHTWGHLSVARHCLWVAEYLGDQGYDKQIQLTGLLHDASEAYIGDMIRPLKHNPKLGTAFAEVDEHVERQIAARFGLVYPYLSPIKEGDNYVLNQIELNDARPEGPARWTWDSDAMDDKYAWLKAFTELGGK